MKLSAVDFFNNLPPKQCRTCGAPLHELADCYLNHCFECMDLHVTSFSVAPRLIKIKPFKSA